MKDVKDRSNQLRFYHRNREKALAATKRHRAKPAGRAPVLLSSCRGRARRKGLEFDLTKEWLVPLLERPCPLTGIEFDFEGGPRNLRTPSVDRIDSSKGYTKDNCRVILWALNAAFGTWGEAAFREILAVERNTPNPSFFFMAA